MLRLLAHEQLSSFGQISHEQTDSNAWESVLAQSLVQSYLMRWTAQAKLVQKNTGQRFPQGIAVNKQISAVWAVRDEICCSQQQRQVTNDSEKGQDQGGERREGECSTGSREVEASGCANEV